MNTHPCRDAIRHKFLVPVAVILCCSLVAQAQVAQPDNPVATDGANQVSNLVTVASVNADSAWHSTPIDQNSTEWTKTEPITNAVTGLLEPHIRRYIEVSSSLNFIS